MHHAEYNLIQFHVSQSAGSIGIGFAIPSNLVKRVADEIIKDGKVKHPAIEHLWTVLNAMRQRIPIYDDVR